MNWAIYLWFALQIFGLGITLATHGESQPNVNFWRTLFSVIISVGLLYLGGAFDNL